MKHQTIEGNMTSRTKIGALQRTAVGALASITLLGACSSYNGGQKAMIAGGTIIAAGAIAGVVGTLTDDRLAAPGIQPGPDWMIYGLSTVGVGAMTLGGGIVGNASAQRRELDAIRRTLELQQRSGRASTHVYERLPPRQSGRPVNDQVPTDYPDESPSASSATRSQNRTATGALSPSASRVTQVPQSRPTQVEQETYDRGLLIQVADLSAIAVNRAPEVVPFDIASECRVQSAAACEAVAFIVLEAGETADEARPIACAMLEILCTMGRTAACDRAAREPDRCGG